MHTTVQYIYTVGSTYSTVVLLYTVQYLLYVYQQHTLYVGGHFVFNVRWPYYCTKDMISQRVPSMFLWKTPASIFCSESYNFLR